ncbi:Scr1 family TA system antitoxin-like transcriptional regulator [Nonomuraea bangladeshensis]
MGFPELGDQSLVYIETATSDLYLEAREELARYRPIFDLIRSSALSPNSSMTYLAKLIERLN